jgi:chaperonin cofactor prefoldin
VGEEILGRSIHPHMFRHTKATFDSSLFTDRELMALFGWKSPEQVSVYSHLSMRDVEEKDLVLHGLKTKEEILRPIVQAQKCASCGTENAPIAIYCTQCGDILTSATEEKTRKQLQQFQERIGKRDRTVKTLAEKFEKATKRLEDLERKMKEKS